MKKITTLGRILFALPFAIFGINHFLMMDYYAGMLTSFIPLGAYTVILTGILMIVTSISIITRKYIMQSTIILASLLLLFIVTIHIPHLIDGASKPISLQSLIKYVSMPEGAITLIALLKDISLMGGSLMIAGMSMENKA
jgi:putative oxidoreductase